MYLLKKYFLSILIIIISVNFLYSANKRELYRSNLNGLSLIKIKQSQRKDFKFVLQVDSSGDLALAKTLYKTNQEIKRWNYTYIVGVISEEKYYKDRKIAEEYFYDNMGHKTHQTEYLNEKPFKNTTYFYNQDGLVEREEILNILTNQMTVVKYRYDKDFKIKQIEKTYSDSRTVYWEAFFNTKGIIIKEYYALKDEVFTFWYNEGGQELNGEVKNITSAGKEVIKLQWKNFYRKDGSREKKEEENILIGKNTYYWYNLNGKETKIETYYNNKIVSIETYDYNEKNKPVYYKEIHDLNLSEIMYKYDEDFDLVEEKYLEDGTVKKIIEYKKDGGKIISFYSRNKVSLITELDKDGKEIKRK
jgi:hypothetical protein